MHIRHAMPTDFPSMGDICREAFWDDELFNFTSPYRAEYPDHFRARFLRSLKTHYYGGSYVLVAETEEKDPSWLGHPKIAGYASWVLKRDGSASFWSEIGPRQIASSVERFLLAVETKYVWYANLDKSQCKANVAEWRKDIARNDVFEGLGDHWDLCFLAVPPHHQRQGVGGLLMDWGLERAKDDKLPVILCASPKGQGLYRKKGFRDFLKLKFPPGGTDAAMIWEPPGMEDVFRSQLVKIRSEELPSNKVAEVAF